MQDKGYDGDWLQCRNKVQNKIKKYRQVKDHNGQTGRGRKTCKYKELDDILGHHPAFLPPILLDTEATNTSCSATEDMIRAEEVVISVATISLLFCSEFHYIVFTVCMQGCVLCICILQSASYYDSISVAKRGHKHVLEIPAVSPSSCGLGMRSPDITMSFPKNPGMKTLHIFCVYTASSISSRSIEYLPASAEPANIGPTSTYA